MAGEELPAGWPGPSPVRWLLVAAAAVVLALAALAPTVMPGVGFWDTAEAQTVPPLLGTMHPTGFPAYVLLGWLASIVLQPLGEPAFRMNLLSALLVATAAGGTVLVGRALRLPAAVGFAAGIGLALTPIAWRISTAADAHALHLVLLVVLVAILLAWERRVIARQVADGVEAGADRWLVLAAAWYGVMAANHSLTLLLAPAIGCFVLVVDPGVLRRSRTVGRAAFALVAVAGLLYLELPLRAGPFRAPLAYGHPETWGGFWYVVLGQQFQGSLTGPLADLPGKAEGLLGLAYAQLGVLALLVPAGFLAAVRWAPRYALLSGLATLLTILFAVSYENADIGRYYLGPAFFAWTWLAILGTVVAGRLARAGQGPLAREDASGGREREPDRPTGWRSAVAAAVVAIALLLPTGLDLGGRQASLDRSGDTLAAQWMTDAFAAMQPDAVVVSWWSYSTTLWYGQLVEGRRPDVRIVDDRTLLDEHLGDVNDVIERNLDARPVYLLRATAADLAAVERRFRLEPAAPGGLYRVAGRREATP